MKTSNFLLLPISIGLLIMVMSFSLMKLSAAQKTTVEEIDKRQFQLFLSNFKDLSLPYSINQKELSEYFNVNRNEASLFHHKKQIDSKFQDFVPGLRLGFSRRGPDIYLYEGIIAQSKTSATVIYSAHTVYKNSYPKFFIVSYDSAGNITYEKTFAYRSQSELIIGLVDEQKNLIIKSYALDFHKDGFHFDQMIDKSKLQLDNISTYSITNNGISATQNDNHKPQKTNKAR